MNPNRPDPRRLAWAPALLAIALAAPAACAQGFDDEDEEEVEAPAGMNPRMFVYTEEHFDQWVFGNGKGPAAFRTSADSLLSMQVDELDRACGLSDAQKTKLKLAARGDLKRIFDAYDEKKKHFQATKGEQARINEVLQDIQPLQLAIASGPFGEGSIFAKSVARTLDPAQAERFEKVAREKRIYRYRARVDLAVNVLDNYVGMTADQRRRLVRVIVDETTPPRKFGRQDYQVVMLLASKIPEAKLRPIFDDDQWGKVRRQMDGVLGLETYLRTNGFLPDDTSGKATAIPIPQPARVQFR